MPDACLEIPFEQQAGTASLSIVKNTHCSLSRWPSFLVVVLIALGISVGHARPAAIEDNAAFFSEPAKAEAARNIGELERSLKKDLAVETFKEIPEELKRGVNLEDKATLSRLCEQWAMKQAKAKGVNGVYILLVKAPAHLQVIVGNDTQKRAFTLQDRDTLATMMLGKLRAKQPDDALLSGVNFVSATMRSHLGSSTAHTGAVQPRVATESSHSSGGGILSILLGVGVVWVVIGIIRGLFRAGSGGSAMSPAGGGGGFLSSMMGGIFGAAAGMWMYDQFFSNHGSSAYGADRDSNTNSGDSGGYTGQDTDYSGGGGSGGGDFGGGDSGGGSGGGDSGGGGGDSGGGGGGDF